MTGPSLVTGADAMRAQGARLARALLAAPANTAWLLTLTGELGAGKTTLVGGLLAELGHAGPARSPTYTLLEPYRLQDRDVVHCDLYRLRHPDELDDLGLRELRGPGSVLLVEWPDKAEGRLGQADVAVNLAYAGPDAREVEFAAATAAGQELLARL